MTVPKDEKPMSDESSQEGGAEEIFEAIHRTMHLIRAEQYRELKESPFEITHLEGKILNFLGRSDGLTLSELVEHFGRDKGQLARLTKTLREQGLVCSNPNSEDRRSSILQLTDLGRKVNDSLLARLAKVSSHAIEGFTKDEQKQFLSYLGRVQSNLKPHV
ncbi:MarR family winged helix-turn-helix transcriptional regulator [Pelagicoccus albus]|uniref:MarR family transcriptional regulator n=1 Tax=Pelagicoccus albus TaxID=415222 RepID=A0A7X1B973_9BACT|nr:MarR family transcriptional regulator [Pelagicoccus albus]MBC2607862.1 MarR family transcriptional regulator [Pelagicoccus albus]